MASSLALALTGCNVIEDLIRSISDGASCTTDDNCSGGTCLTEADGFPGGYCTTLQCDSQGCSNPFGAECLQFNQSGSAPLCFSACEDDDECRDDEGYRCIDADGAQICLPGTIAEDFPAAGETGTSCSRDEDCFGGTCMLNYTGGYCTTMNCDSDGQCAETGDGRCIEMGTDTTFTACFDGCQNDANCRFGYGCADPDGGGGICEILDDGNPVRNPNGDDDGQPCTVDINCKGGTCLRTEEGFPGGYCTTLSCSRVGCNSNDAQCVAFENNTACFVNCTDNNECRDGYECLPGGYCSPPPNLVTPQDPTGSIDIICESDASNNGRMFTFQIDPGTESFAIVPHTTDGSEIRPIALYLPDGSVGADFFGSYSFLDVNWELLVNLGPVFFPAAPQFADITQQAGGEYQLEVATDASNPCYYLLEKPSEGDSIFVNLYLVGVPGVTANNAPNDGNIIAIMNTFQDIYSNAGIQLGGVRYFELSEQDTARFSIIRDFNEIFELLTRSQPPGDTLAENLSVNIFLIQDFAVPAAPGLLGLSAGIPGVPGLHGNHGSGLVFTSAPLGSDNVMLGSTMAHEVGHFNGLRHTTEHDFTHDPIDDTPQCSDPNAGAACPDATNFMFPFSLGGTPQTGITNGQSQVLRWSPLVQ